MVDFDEIFTSPAFWILGAGGVAMEIIGFMIAGRTGMATFPLWEKIVLVLGTLVAAAFFATRD